MSVFWGITIFVVGVATGAGGSILHNKGVRRAVHAVTTRKNAEIAKLRSAYEQLQDEASINQQARDCSDAFRYGKTLGRAAPMSGAERFAKTFEGRTAKFVDTTRRDQT